MDGTAIAIRADGRTHDLPAKVAREIESACARIEVLDDELSPSASASIGQAIAMRPVVGSGPPPPWREELTGPRTPVGTDLRTDSQPFREVLEKRRSVRDLKTASAVDLATVMVRAGRIIDVSKGPDGYVTSHRPFPSGGARHPLELHLLASGVDGLDEGHYAFDPLSCELVLLDADAMPRLERLHEILACARRPSAALFAVAHPERTLSRYPDGMSLVWRDAGALLATAHLCATDLGIESCIVGSTGILTGGQVESPIDVGCLAVGATRV